MKDEEKAKIRAEIIMSLKKGYKPKVTMTAVEWLVEQIYTIQKELEAGNTVLKNKIKQAKEMEKEQIIDACEFGKAFGLNQAWGYYNPIVNPEQYYNKTFKSE